MYDTIDSPGGEAVFKYLQEVFRVRNLHKLTVLQLLSHTRCPELSRSDTEGACTLAYCLLTLCLCCDSKHVFSGWGTERQGEGPRKLLKINFSVFIWQTWILMVVTAASQVMCMEITIWLKYCESVGQPQQRMSQTADLLQSSFSSIKKVGNVCK